MEGQRKVFQGYRNRQFFQTYPYQVHSVFFKCLCFDRTQKLNPNQTVCVKGVCVCVCGRGGGCWAEGKIKFCRAELDHINIPICFNKVNMTLLPAKSRLPAETPEPNGRWRAPRRQPADQSLLGHSICRPRHHSMA